MTPTDDRPSKPADRPSRSGQEAAVSAFGKLPCFGDFIRVRMAGEPSASLEAWVTQSMEWAEARKGPSWRHDYDAGVIHAFLYRAPRSIASSNVLAGIVKPSRDSVGRRYPLVLFCPLAEKSIQAPHILPLALGDFLEEATTTALASETFTSPTQLEHLLNVLSAPRLDRSDSYVREYDTWSHSSMVQNAWGAIFGATTNATPAAAVHTIVEAFAPFHGQEAPSTVISVRLPLGIGGAGAAAFWVDVVRRLGGWKKTIPTSFWSFDGQSGSILIQLGETPSSTLGELWSPDPSSDHVCDLTIPNTMQSGRYLRQLPGRISAPLENERTTVIDFLNILKGA